MEKPYVSRIDQQLEDFTVWNVDGEYIRNNVNREFTNFGQHYRFPFIPKYEFWIDHHKASEEEAFFIEHLQVEWHYMSIGESYDVALEKADRREKFLRNKSKLMDRVIENKSKYPKEVPKIIYIGKFQEIGKEITIWIVNGEAVRDAYFIDFTEGGHHFVYNFIPEKELWLDNDLIPDERSFVILHELHERNLMSTGITYEKAHASSSAIEYICRREANKLNQYIDSEIKILVKV